MHKKKRVCVEDKEKGGDEVGDEAKARTQRRKRSSLIFSSSSSLPISFLSLSILQRVHTLPLTIPSHKSTCASSLYPLWCASFSLLLFLYLSWVSHTQSPPSLHSLLSLFVAHLKVGVSLPVVIIVACIASVDIYA